MVERFSFLACNQYIKKDYDPNDKEDITKLNSKSNQSHDHCPINYPSIDNLFTDTVKWKKMQMYLSNIHQISTDENPKEDSISECKNDAVLKNQAEKDHIPSMDDVVLNTKRNCLKQNFYKHKTKRSAQINREEPNEMYIGNLTIHQLENVQAKALKTLNDIEIKYNITHPSNSKINRLTALTESKSSKQEGNIFGKSLVWIQQNHSGALPSSIIECMVFLLSISDDHLDLFRKPAVKSKIAEIKRRIKACKDLRLKNDSAYAIADIIRLYFRELPESLISRYYTETLKEIFTVLPDSSRKDAVRNVISLLPDCNRIVLEAVLRFLHEYAFSSENNCKMQGLSRLFVPSIFHFYPAKIKYNKGQSRFFTMRGTHDMEQSTLESCLIFMVINVNEIFKIPNEFTSNTTFVHKPMSLRKMLLAANITSPNDNIQGLVSSDIRRFFKTIYKSKDAYHSISHTTSLNNINVKCFKTDQDGAVFRSTFVVKCDIVNLAQCILNDRAIWDADFSDFRLVEKFDGADIIQYVTKPFNPLAARSFCEFRYAQWIRQSSQCHSNEKQRKWLLIGSQSIEHKQNKFLPGVVGKVDYCYFLLKPIDNKMVKIKFFYRLDLKGCSFAWYNNIFIHKVAKCLRDIKFCCT